MKTGFAFLVLLAASFQALAQGVENDDMYFTSKDRVKQTVLVNNERSSREKTTLAEDNRMTSTAINPTDSYSARNINPEYVSRSVSGSEDTVEDPGYFQSSYTPASVNKNLYNNYSPNSFYSPYYANGYGYNGFNNYAYSPYSMYGMGGMGMYSPYSMYGMGGMGFRPGLSLGLGLGYGSMYSMYGMGMGMGYGWGMYDPFYSSMYGMGYGMGYGSMMYSGMYGGMFSPFGYGGMYSPYGYGYYPGSVVVVNGGDAGRNLSYQRRSDRSRVVSNNTVSNSGNNTRNITSSTRNGRVIGATSNNGRMSGTSSNAQAQNYYQRGWRNNGTVTTTGRGSAWNNNGTSTMSGNSNSGRMRSWGNTGGNTSSWNNNSHSGSFNNGGNSFGGSRSSSWGTGSPSRSSSWGGGNSFGGSSFGGGGGGHSGGGGGGGRGRH